MSHDREPEHEPTIEELCDHTYYGDEDAPPEYEHEAGRCYCGKVRYPKGGPR